MADDPSRTRLGRGLAALIGDMGSEATVIDRGRVAVPKTKLPIEFLRANPNNPRKDFAESELQDLTASIREKGIVQPILVRPVAGASDSYEIIAGERRWRAAQKAGLHEVPVVVHEVDDKEALELAIIENVQRADLNPLEEAIGYQQLIDGYGYGQSALADVIGKSRPYVANTLRLMKLPEAVKDYLRSGKLSAGHARALINVADPEAVAKRIVEAGMTVRDVEAIGRGGGKARAGKPEKDADIRAAERAISDAIGLAVTIDHKRGGGSVTIRYKTLEQFDEIQKRLTGI
ncbi:MAG: ParB/RepB/Spo0J family partition protein [Bauldia sp.]